MQKYFIVSFVKQHSLVVDHIQFVHRTIYRMTCSSIEINSESILIWLLSSFFSVSVILRRFSHQERIADDKYLTNSPIDLNFYKVLVFFLNLIFFGLGLLEFRHKTSYYFIGSIKLSRYTCCQSMSIYLPEEGLHWFTLCSMFDLVIFNSYKLLYLVWDLLLPLL